uniref:Uncharacterized protein n=1 Tax=Ditylenchus dipsaci TaxID=166011 RepID=A0A915DNQ0_9BILA
MSAWINAYACKHYNLNCPYRPATQNHLVDPCLFLTWNASSNSVRSLLLFLAGHYYSGTILQVLIVILLAAIFLCLVINWIKTMECLSDINSTEKKRMSLWWKKEDP